jgi:hypothetical protein
MDEAAEPFDRIAGCGGSLECHELVSKLVDQLFAQRRSFIKDKLNQARIGRAHCQVVNIGRD